MQTIAERVAVADNKAITIAWAEIDGSILRTWNCIGDCREHSFHSGVLKQLHRHERSRYKIDGSQLQWGAIRFSPFWS